MNRICTQLLASAIALALPACAPLFGPGSYTDPAASVYPAQARIQPQPAPRQATLRSPVPRQPALNPTPVTSTPAYSAPQSQAGRSKWRFAGTPFSEPLAGGAQRWKVKVSDGQQIVELHAVSFNSGRYALKVVDQPQPNAGGGVVAGAMRFHRAVAGVNGGYFTPEFAPLGRTIASGVGKGALSSTSLLSGMVVGSSGQPHLVWRQEFLGERGVTDLVQSGPRLVDNGAPIAGLERTKSRQRTFIATDGRSGWVIGVARSTSLGALAEILASPDVIPNTRIKRALNLDGGNSTAIWMRTAQGQEISEPGWSTVRNYIAIVPR